MSASLKYDKIIKYKISAKCEGPMHIGSALGDKENVLIHPVDNIPFIQASSIAGLFRAYYKEFIDTENGKKTSDLFGLEKMSEGMNSAEHASKIKFTDGVFEQNNKLKLELRPRVSIDDTSGTCKSEVVKGTSKRAGHKFNMEHIGVGAEFVFYMYLYLDTREYTNTEDEIEEVLAAINTGTVSIGGQKSNGNGLVKITDVKKKSFSMLSCEDREAWENEDEIPDDAYDSIACGESTKALPIYDIYVNGVIESELLIKGIAVTPIKEKDKANNNSKDKKELPDYENIRNAEGEYIIPASSLKGAIRSQMQYIANYLDVKDIIDNTFGVKPNGKSKPGLQGNIKFFDTIVGNKQTNENLRLSHRIHIDKFTGGVMYGSLFSEKNVCGKVDFHIQIKNSNEPERSCGLLLMALRDLYLGTASVGGGYNVGKGFINVKKITVEANGKKACIDFTSKDNIIHDNDKILSACINSVKKGG